MSEAAHPRRLGPRWLLIVVSLGLALGSGTPARADRADGQPLPRSSEALRLEGVTPPTASASTRGDSRGEPDPAAPAVRVASLDTLPAARSPRSTAADTTPDRGPAPAPPDTTPRDSVQPLPERGAGHRIPLAADADLLARASLHGLSAPLRWRGREWAMAGASLAVVALASTLDEEGRQLMADIRTDRNSRIERAIEPFGAHRSLHLLGGMLVGGIVLDDQKLRSTAVEGLAAGLVAGGIITPTLQKVIGRPKPRAGLPAHTYDPFDGGRSLPSGHTTQAFAVASVIATEYDHPLVQVGAYGLAAAVGVSRMYRRSHFLSDVVGAAIIGTATGRTVARYGIRRRGSVTVAPLIGGDTAGLELRLGF